MIKIIFLVLLLLVPVPLGAVDLDHDSSEYLSTTTIPVTSLPVSMACWFKVEDETKMDTDNDGEPGIIIFSIDTDAVQGKGGLYYDYSTGSDIVASVRSNNAQSDFIYNIMTNDSDNQGVVEDRWQLAVHIYNSSTSHTGYLDSDIVSATNSTSSTASGSDDEFFIGAIKWFGGGASQFFDGKIAQCGVWDDDLTVSEVSCLAGRGTPSECNSGDLVAYWPLIDNGDDAEGSNDLTSHNTPTWDGEDPLSIMDDVPEASDYWDRGALGGDISFQGTGEDKYHYGALTGGPLIRATTSKLCLYHIGTEDIDGTDPVDRSLFVSRSYNGGRTWQDTEEIIQSQATPADEEGIFACAGFLDSTTINLLCMDMEENPSPGNVDGDIKHWTAPTSDCSDLTDNGVVMSSTDSGIAGITGASGDELIPWALWKEGSNWNLYYTASSSEGNRQSIFHATGTTIATLDDDTAEVLDFGETITGASATVIDTANLPTADDTEEGIIGLVKDDSSTFDMYLYVFDLSDPRKFYDEPIRDYTSLGIAEGAVHYDDDLDIWYYFYSDDTSAATSEGLYVETEGMKKHGAH